MTRDGPATAEVLLAACLAGEAGAFERLVAACRRAIEHAARRALAPAGASADADLVEEVVQRVVAALAADDRAALRRFRGRSQLTTYIAVMTRRIAQRAFDEHRPRRSQPLDGGLAAAQPGPLERAERSEEGALLERALAGLAARDALALRLFHQHGRSHRQVAVALGVPITHVGQILARAREKLRVALKRAGVRA